MFVQVQRRRSADLPPLLEGSRSTTSLVLFGVSRIDYVAPRVFQVQRRRSLWEFSPLTWAAHPESLWCHFRFVRTIFVLRPMDFDPLEDEHCAAVSEGMWETDLLSTGSLMHFIPVSQFEWLLNACPEIQLNSRNRLQANGHPVLGSTCAREMGKRRVVPVLASLYLLRQSTLDRAVDLLVPSIRAAPNFFKSRIHDTGGINLSFMTISYMFTAMHVEFASTS
ncbi:hypothetical protein B0H19DRAFT_1081510 [Mycena capillaripes]|nr:hypothetical protein B0H19DRAFT_1081510 [Mycena capillaripes]